MEDNQDITSDQLLNENEFSLEKTLRPQLLVDYLGQEKIKKELAIYIEAAKKRGRSVRPCPPVWTARPWKNNDGYGYR